MTEIYYLSEGKLYTVRDGVSCPLPCEATEKYIQNLKEIEQRQEWKTGGAGARFMGAGLFDLRGTRASSESALAQVESLSAFRPEKLVYAATLESSCGLYTKNPSKEGAAEGFILRLANTRIFHIDCSPDGAYTAASVSDGPLERHIALIAEEHADFKRVTEGETVEIMPSFSRRDPRLIYFSSAGYYVDRRKGKTYYSGYCLNCLDLQKGDLTEIIADEKYDFIRPRETAAGKLYCIRRPKAAPKENNVLIDLLLVPFRLLKAVFGWMNFFTRRYTGENLVKGRQDGDNPAKYHEKSDEDIFIDGNLINAEKSLRENARSGERNPGIAPRNWELGLVDAAGNFLPLRQGVLDYAFDGDDLILSNGKFLIRRQTEGEEEILCPAGIATNLTVI